MTANDAGGALRSAWVAAVIVSLLLHALLAVGLKHFAPLAARHGALPPDAEFIPIDLADLPWPAAAEPASLPAADSPREFTELPADRADVPPARADFLSNVDSRARDLLPGGEDGALPHSAGRAELPQVAMTPGAGASAEADPPQAAAASPAAAQPPGSEAVQGPSGEAATGDAQAEVSPNGEGLRRLELPRQGSPTGTDPLAAFRRFDPSALEAVPTPSAGARAAAPGNADIAQEGLASPDGNVRLLGEVSLNTSAWVYGFWMQRFRRAVEAHWHPPYAFQIGVIKGWTLVALEVSRTGALLQLEVQGEEGHWTLRDASVAAIKAAAPFEPLPADAPEPSIRLQIRMIYEDFRR